MATLNDLKALFQHRPKHEVAIEISGFTGFRTTLIEELTPEEINRLWEIYNPESKEQFTQKDAENEKRKWTSYILTIATEEGLHRPVMIKKNGKIVEDKWYAFNCWMLAESTAKKLLYFCNLEELKAVHRQLCKLRDNNEKSAKKPFNKAWWRKANKNKDLN